LHTTQPDANPFSQKFVKISGSGGLRANPLLALVSRLRAAGSMALTSIQQRGEERHFDIQTH
jgi:hypothetical protein